MLGFVEFKESAEEIEESFGKGQVTIHSPGHPLHGKTGDVFHRHDDGRVNVQIRHSNRKGDVTNLTLGKDQYKEVTKEAVDDKDLPFTPDAKKTKPSTPGKYGSAYSTVRHLARQAMQKQAQKMKKEEGGKISVTEEEQLDEKSAQARANKARKNVMDAGRGIAYRQKTGVNLEPKDTGHDSYQAMNKALGRQLRRKEIEEGWYQKASPSYARIRHGQDLNKKTEDEHYDKQTPKMQDAINRHLRTGKSYKDAVAAAQKHIKEEIEEGYRGNSEADKPFFAAQDHKKAAEKARKSGDHFSYHKHMSAHHDAMEQWNSNKGRTHVANQHAMKADEHEDYAQQARKGSK